MRVFQLPWFANTCAQTWPDTAESKSDSCVSICCRSAMAIGCRRQCLEFWWEINATWWIKSRLANTRKCWHLFSFTFSAKLSLNVAVFHRFPLTWHWSLRTPTTCCCSRHRRRTQRRVRTSTPSSCHWPAAWRPRSPGSTGTWSGKTGESDSHRRRKQRLTVRVEKEEDREAFLGRRREELLI